MGQATLTSPAELAAWFDQLRAGDRLQRGENTFYGDRNEAYHRGEIYLVDHIVNGCAYLRTLPVGGQKVSGYHLEFPRMEVKPAETAPDSVTFRLGIKAHTASWQKVAVETAWDQTRQENARRTLARRARQRENAAGWSPEYETWRHGGWYVANLVYPSGAVGCVSRNYTDKKWRIVCQNTGPGVEGDRTFATRNEAAYAELALVLAMPEEYDHADPA